MLHKKFLPFLFILFYSSYAFALDTASIKYMPMHVGDFWVYYGSYADLQGGYNWYDRIKVTQYISANNHIYFYISSTNINIFPSGYYRIDSITGSLYVRDTTGSCIYYNHEKLVDSISASYADTIRNCRDGGYICNGILPTILFGDSSTYKINFNWTRSGPNWGATSNRAYIKKFGLYSFSENGHGSLYASWYSVVLKGCKINGAVHGDTSTVSINKINEVIPSDYRLYQNYPNPFNPLTKIRFDIPKKSHTKLVIYNNLGQTISKLLDEELTEGTYNYDFYAGNLASGIYFYRIEANEFRKTLKMVIIK